MSKAPQNQQPRRPRVTVERFPDESAGDQPGQLGRPDPTKFGSPRDETEKADDYYYGSGFSDDQYRE